MKTTKRAKVASIVEALLQKTTENGATEAEAMAAAEKARELMDRHQLDLGEVGMAKEGVHKASIKRGHYKTLAVKDRLAHFVSEFCDTRVWLTKSSDQMHFFGLRSDAEFAGWLVQSLETFVSHGALAFIASQPFMEARTRWEAEKAFVLGAIDRINQRLAELTRERRASMAKTKGDGRSLVVVKSAIVETEFAKLGLTLGKGGKLAASAKDRGAYGAGRAAGDKASFGRPVNGGKGTAQIGKASA
jgi:Protein of unknown function (DUF2786)